MWLEIVKFIGYSFYPAEYMLSYIHTFQNYLLYTPFGVQDRLTFGLSGQFRQFDSQEMAARLHKQTDFQPRRSVLTNLT